MANTLRQMVSKKKKRFTEDDFNLDLSYITPQIIAMGVPAETYERIYRNDINEVVRFLEKNHCNKYWVYNLCVERAYDTSKFQDRVDQFPMQDHNPPPIDIIPDFCSSVYRWLEKGTDYVAAIHCKAGKGRTGAMVCCYLLFESFHGLHGKPPSFLAAADVLHRYDERRTHDNKGVTIPSQRRYVFYYAHMLRKQLTLESCNLLLTSVTVEGGQPAFQSGCCIMFKCMKMVSECCQDNKGKLVTIGESEWVEPKRAQNSAAAFAIRTPAPIPLSGDFKLEFYNRRRLSRQDKVFHCWLNTFFVVNQPQDTPGALWRKNRMHKLNEQQQQHYQVGSPGKERVQLSVTLTKSELDKACKDSEHRVYPEGFAITINFAIPDSSTDFGDDDSRVVPGIAVATGGSLAASSSSCSSATDDSDCCEFVDSATIPSPSAASLSDCSASSSARLNGVSDNVSLPSANRQLSPLMQHRHQHRHQHLRRSSNSPSPVSKQEAAGQLSDDQNPDLILTTRL